MPLAPQSHCKVVKPFRLEGTKYEIGQMIGESFPLGSIECSLRTGLLAEVSADEFAASQVEVKGAEEARQEQAKEPAKEPAKKEPAGKKKSDT